MAYITAEMLENFMGKYSREGDTLPAEYARSAQEIVAKYLGYDPEEKTYTTKRRGDNGAYFVAAAMPVGQITSFKIDGTASDTSLLCVPYGDRPYIGYEDGDTPFYSCFKYELTYKAGYGTTDTVHTVYSDDGESYFMDSELTIAATIPDGVTPQAVEGETDTYTYTTSVSNVPGIIKTVALQIGSLLWESAGGNLAVSSTSYADTGSRVFNNFEAERYLKTLEAYRMPHI